MYFVTPNVAATPIRALPISGNVTSIRKVVKTIRASERKTKIAQDIHAALAADKLTLEEDFYVFDYGNAI